MNQPQEVLVKAVANLWRGPEAVGGQLMLTKDWLSFRAHALNFQSAPLDIRVADIASTVKFRNFGIVPNGLAVTLVSGAEYRFAVGKRDRFISGIDANRPATPRA